MVESRAYAPGRGDIVWISLHPQAGHEQTGRRPALILSPAVYNRQVGLALLCPITRQIKGYPFEVRLPEGLPVSGVVLADQVKSLDWRIRQAERIGKVSEEILGEVFTKLMPLLKGQ